MFVEVAKKGDIAPGGMLGFRVRGVEIVLCNDGGRYYAISRRCGHMRARLDKGTLVGYILTCPWHYSQFDIQSGAALSGPVPPGPPGEDKRPRGPAAFLRSMGGLMDRKLMAHKKTCNIKTFKVRVEGDGILVDL